MMRWWALTPWWVKGIGLFVFGLVFTVGPGIIDYISYFSPPSPTSPPVTTTTVASTGPQRTKRVPVSGETTWWGHQSRPLVYLGLRPGQEKLLDQMVVTKVCVRPRVGSTDQWAVTALNYRSQSDIPLSRLGQDGCMEFDETPMKPWGCYCARACGGELWCRVEGYVEVPE